MYIPNYFKNENLEEVKDFLNENSFGILISQLDGKITGTHIPMDLDVDENGENILVGHIAKVNPQSKDLKNEQEILAIFNGPQCYISSSWYQKENVPTWNYIAVHVYGKVRIIEGEELLEWMKKQVDKYERQSENPVSIEKMSSKTLAQINGIVGFTIKINEIQAAYKLSQNRDDVDYHNIIRELEKNGDSNSLDIANELKNNRRQH